MLVFLISVVVLILDQWSKFLTVSHIPLAGHQSFIDGFISFTYFQNTGSAFSLFEGQTWYGYVVMALTVVVTIVLGYLIVKFRKDSKWFTIGLALILGGALGNFVDRVHYGFVVDMIQTDFINFPIFNVADMALCVGVACIFIYLILDEKKNTKEKEIGKSI